MGDTAAPGGQLFTLAVLTIVAYFGGWLLLKVTTLPALIGMLIVGIIMKNVGFVNFDDSFNHVTSYIRYHFLTKISLVLCSFILYIPKALIFKTTSVAYNAMQLQPYFIDLRAGIINCRSFYTK